MPDLMNGESFSPARIPLTVGENMYARMFYPRIAEIIHLARLQQPHGPSRPGRL